MVTDLKSQFPTIYKKLDVLCHGIVPNDLSSYYYYKQNPHDTKRTGNAGLQLKLGTEKLALNVAVFQKFCKNSPYSLIKDANGQLFLQDSRDKSTIIAFCPDTAPNWYTHPLYDTQTKSKALVGDYVLLEGDFTAITAITNGCTYFNLDKQCAFCAIGKETTDLLEKKKREKYVEESLLVIADDNDVFNFHLTCGNTLTQDRGAKSCYKYVKALRNKRKNAMIAVEISPPEIGVQMEVFKELKNLGTDSITINMEFWNDKIRRKLMPIKGYIPKEEYLSAFQVALQFFGKNKVTCGFIVGVEDIEDSKEGIHTLAKMGVIPEVYPFKPNDNSLMEGYPITDTSIMMEASLFANDEMQLYGIRPDECSGCVKCGACGITQQLIGIKSKG